MFWGVKLDTVAQTSQLQVDKLVALWGLLAEFKAKWKASLQELQRFIGHLYFACDGTR